MNTLGFQATTENWQRRCGHDMVQQSVSSTSSSNQKCLIADGIQLCMADRQWICWCWL